MKLSAEGTKQRGENIIRLCGGHGRVHKGIAFGDESVLWLAESIFTLVNKNPSTSGFPEFRDLPDHLKDHWIRLAQEWIRAIVDKAKSLAPHPFDGIEGLRPVDRKDLEEYERAMREEAIPAMIEERRRQAQLAQEARGRVMFSQTKG